MTRLVPYGIQRIAPVPVWVAVLGLIVTPIVVLMTQIGAMSMDGFDALRELLEDSRFTDACRRTVVYTVSTVAFQVVIGVGAAIAVDRMGRLRPLMTLLFFLPYAVPSVTAVVAWNYLIADQGLLATALESSLGIDAASWQGSRALWTVIAISVWQFFPFAFIAALARLRRIPSDLYRSVQIDGGSSATTIRVVTLPALQGTIVAIVVVRVLFMLTKFDTPYLFAGKTVNEHGVTLPVYIWNNGVGCARIDTDGGRAALLLGVLVALGVGSSALVARLVRRPT